MSRLAFDDLFQSNSMDSIASRAISKNRTDNKKTEDSSFDDSFKQAVDELNPKENKVTDEENSAEANEVKPTKEQNDSDEPETTAAEVQPTGETAEESTDTEDPDDVLIAMVMAAADQQNQTDNGEAVAEGEATTVTDTTQEAVDSTETLTGETVTTLAETMSTEETDALVQETESAESTEPVITSSEIVVPEETQTDTSLAQATVATTETDAQATEGDTASENTEGLGLDAGQQNAASQEGVNQQNTNADQSSDHNESETGDDSAESETATAQTSTTATAAQNASDSGEESAVETTDKQENKSETTVKTETPIERPTGGPETTRTGQQTNTGSTQQSTEPTLDTADRVRFVERVAQAFRAQSSENSPVRMRLHPEELGSIRLEMTVRNGTMHARIETETQEARQVLLDNLPALRDRLANQHNIKVEQFDIHYNAGGDQQGLPHSPEDWDGSNQNGPEMPNEGSAATAEESENAEPTRRAASLTGAGKQIDVTA